MIPGDRPSGRSGRPAAAGRLRPGAGLRRRPARRLRERFAAAGATLDPCRRSRRSAGQGSRRQASAIAAIVADCDRDRATESRSAGGLRTSGDVDAALGAGAGRVVLGTAALRDPGVRRATPSTATAPESDRRRRSTSATGWRSATAGCRAPPAAGRRRDPARWPTSASRRSWSPRSSATACSAARISRLLDALVGARPAADVIASGGIAHDRRPARPSATSAAPARSSAGRSTRERSISAKRSRQLASA